MSINLYDIVLDFIEREDLHNETYYITLSNGKKSLCYLFVRHHLKEKKRSYSQEPNTVDLLKFLVREGIKVEHDVDSERLFHGLINFIDAVIGKLPGDTVKQHLKAGTGPVEI